MTIDGLSVETINGVYVNKNLVLDTVAFLKKEFKFNILNLLLVFVDDDYIQKINVEYLRHDYATDIITFNYSEKFYILDGEIYISVDEAGYNAKLFGVSVDDEIVRLVIHGILHLAGYDDMDPVSKCKMKRIEDHIVEKFRKAY